jgi:peptidylprolyl isomerase
MPLRPSTEKSPSVQWFFLLFDPELVTSGRNLMDGRYSTFGYVIEGNRQLSNLNVGDVIESAKVVKGTENLINGFQPK